jgi:hypothetical protein
MKQYRTYKISNVLIKNLKLDSIQKEKKNIVI